MSRYPFPVPFGWFQVAWPHELVPGQAVPRYYFGRHLVLWRDDDGGFHTQDAFCPHLGAHLGHGGIVKGCEIECPFHGWEFDAEGRNTDIPYSKRTNAKARLRTFPTIERNGLVMAWYHPDEAVEPMWEIPEIPEFATAGQGEFASPTFRQYTVQAAWQELAENGADPAHFRYVHQTETVPEVEEYHSEGVHAVMRSSQKFPTPRGVVEGRIDVDNWGPGFAITKFSGIVDTYLMGCNTPIDADSCQLNFTFTVRELGDEGFTSSVGQAFVDEVHKQVLEDGPIWENKAHLVRPALADTDGPFTRFRKWAAQFYAEPVESDRLVWEPPPPGTFESTMTATGATASRKHRGSTDA
jgi:phenylpropionate dioxygenase-like ring-hydroxylating dioxygenase large terminal subunit